MTKSCWPDVWQPDCAEPPPEIPAPQAAPRPTLLYRLAQTVFVGILVLNGTYFRNRETVAVPTIDWYVLARLAACAAGCAVAVLLIPKNAPWGRRGKCVVLYVAAAWISLSNTHYPTAVGGYAILLSGAALLTLALVYHARSVAELENLQRLWRLTVSALVIKDTVTALFFAQFSPADTGGRLGMGVTHATELSLLAAILFWMSWGPSKHRYPVAPWLWRAFLIFVILSAKSRVSVVSLVIGGFSYFFFGTRDFVKRAIFVTGSAFAVVSLLLALSLGQGWASGVTDYMKRGQNTTELTSVTGRTFIWTHIAGRIHESPLVGNGFGVSRLVMGKVPGMNWEPPHCHNEFLEVLFSMGVVGLIPFAGMILLSLRWFTDSDRLGRVVSPSLARHAACLISMLLVSVMFEVRLSGKISTIQPLFFFYLATLDRANRFSAAAQPPAGRISE